MPPFQGSGVYALFYIGSMPEYQALRSPDGKRPIYVGKAVPEGARKGARNLDVESTARGPLCSRLREHRNSINAATNLSPADFICRYIVITPVWITMSERFLIENFQPAWNVALEGFGNHAPGKGRKDTDRPLWDILHPGRKWADKLVATRTREHAVTALNDYISKHPPGAPPPPLPKAPEAYMEDEHGDAEERDD
ncbi:Eco29kI family restriction endonuclease [Myxococcus sp. AB025B]|uniref:Eco29kI family restriction endonuclease n=1 Tax=Myxococcus sp. AB025B TaxID=2562794 RepID=UPI0034CD50CC